MMCYKDKTFCKFNDCKIWKKCDRAFTKTEQAAAQKWWGNKGEAPICVFSEKPNCYKKGKNYD